MTGLTMFCGFALLPLTTAPQQRRLVQLPPQTPERAVQTPTLDIFAHVLSFPLDCVHRGVWSRRGDLESALGIFRIPYVGQDLKPLTYPLPTVLARFSCIKQAGSSMCRSETLLRAQSRTTLRCHPAPRGAKLPPPCPHPAGLQKW